MRSSVRIAILTLFAAGLPAVTAAQPAVPAPKAVIEKPTIDVGEVSRGETIKVDFEIKNEGNAPLEITAARPSCGCTVADYTKMIEPGQAGRVHAEVDTVTLLGANSKNVTVFTNDTTNPRFTLTIQSDVKPYVFAEPGYARYTLFVANDRDQTSTQILWSRDFPDLKVEKVESPKPYIQVNLREASAEERRAEGQGKQWAIDVTLAKTAPVGPLTDNIQVTFNHPKQKVMEIPVSGFVRPVVAVTPAAVNFGTVNPADPQKWGVLVKNFGSAALELSTVENSVPGIDVAIESIEAGRQYKLIFWPKPDMAKGEFAGKVTFKTNLPQQDKIVVDLRGTVN